MCTILRINNNYFLTPAPSLIPPSVHIVVVIVVVHVVSRRLVEQLNVPCAHLLLVLGHRLHRVRLVRKHGIRLATVQATVIINHLAVHRLQWGEELKSHKTIKNLFLKFHPSNH